MAPHEDLGERITAVEIKVDRLLEDEKDRSDKLDDLIETIRELRFEMDRYKGFMGAITLILGGIGALAFKYALPLWQWMKGTGKTS